MINHRVILAATPNLEIARSLTQQGFSQLYNGEAETALKTWQSAYRAYEQLGNKPGMAGSLINQSLSLQALGSYASACQVLTQALSIEEKICPSSLQRQANISQTLSFLTAVQESPTQDFTLVGLYNLANVLRVLGEPESSYVILQKCLDLAKLSKNTEIQNNLLLNLANTEVILYNQAKSKYQLTDDFTAQTKALILAKSKFDAAQQLYQQLINSPSNISLQAKLNLLKLLLDNKLLLSQDIPLDISISNLVNDIVTNLKQFELPPKIESIYSQLNFSKNLIKIVNNQDIKVKDLTKTNLVSLALSLSQEALANAKKLNNSRAIAYANGILGYLYFTREEPLKAEHSFNEGMLYAQAVQAWDIAYQWQWELARLSQLSGKIEQANQFYATAIKNLDKVRSDILLFNSDIQFGFQEKVEPLYREYIALLLNRDKSSKSYERQATEIQEQLNFAELENFLRCGRFAENAIEVRNNKSKDLPYIIYLIKLADRVEIIVKTPNDIYRHTVDLAIISEPLTNLLNIIQKTDSVNTKNYEYLSYSQTVYELLFEPIRQYLPTSGQLGFVLDGYFQNLPMSILHDGQQYLFEPYIISIGSSAKQLRQSHFNPTPILVSGVSQIGPSFNNPIVPKDLPPLPQVKREIEDIKRSNPSALTLIDSEFTRDRFQQDIESNSFSTIHLSSHGQFSSDPEQTFVLAWDKPLDIQDLKLSFQNKTNLDLLVLSACQTAKGDRRSFLGIAGVAAQAGARGVLASLWLVDAESTAQLMSKFYDGLNQGLTKAEALHFAQLSLLKSDKYSHPYYWSAFVLVGG
ncbi:MAG TPA: CHAT domain-containing protein [Leptolyngbyaceae cyanobacterium]